MVIGAKYIRNLIAKQAGDNGLVVWYDSDCAYSEAAAALDLPATTVIHYDGSFVQLRLEIDQRKLLLRSPGC